MQYVTGYMVDAKDGISANLAPLRNGPAVPHPELVVAAVDRRKSPPLVIGTLPEGVALPSALTLVSEAEYHSLLSDYTTWREECASKALAKRRSAMVISRFQARAILRQRGLRGKIEQIMGDPATDPLVIDAWQDAQEFRRTSPMLNTLAVRLGLSDGDLDRMFEEAAKIEA